MEQRARQELTGGESFGQYQLTHHIESYMLHQGSKFVRRFDANTYLCNMGVWQSVDLLGDAGCTCYEELLSPCRNLRFMVFSIDSDVCYYPSEQQLLVRELRQLGISVRHVTLHYEKGHDSFLLEPELFMPHLYHSLDNGWW